MPLPNSALTAAPRQYQDRYQAVPAGGFGELVSNMLDHPLIETRTNTALDQLIPVHERHGVWAGLEAVYLTSPVDEYFGAVNGKLQWRMVQSATQEGPTNPNGAERLVRQPAVAILDPNPAITYSQVIEYSQMLGDRRLGDKSAQRSTSSVIKLRYTSNSSGAELCAWRPLADAHNKALYDK